MDDWRDFEYDDPDRNLAFSEEVMYTMLGVAITTAAVVALVAVCSLVMSL